MAATFKEKIIIQYSVGLTLQNGDEIRVSLKSGMMGYWCVNLPTGIEFSVQDIIDIATVVYDAEVFSENYSYNLLCDNWPDKIIIHGKNKVVEDVISQIKIPFAKKEES